MPNNKEYFMELILKKLKNKNLKKISLEKEEFNQFINYLLFDK